MDDADDEDPDALLATGMAEPTPSTIHDIQNTEQFIEALKNATLDDEPLPEHVIHNLRNPLQEPVDISDPDLRFSVDLYLAINNASEKTYNAARAASLKRHPEDNVLSYHLVKKAITELSGVTEIRHDMCINSCLAYTNHHAEKTHCSICGESRYDTVQLEQFGKKVARQTFATIPIGPQIQALYRSPESAEAMGYRNRKTKEILQQLADHGELEEWDDVFCGSEYIEAVAREDITENDTVIMGSLDGCQLYTNKKSDCWVGIWVVLDLAPEIRYKKKHVLPSIIIPGPNKPKDIDSFRFPGFRHLAALQREGLQVWNCLTNRVVTNRPFFLYDTADAPGMTYLNGLVGHHGAIGCRLYCPLRGRRKRNGTHYYPALLKPLNYDIPGCNHDDVDGRNIPPASIGAYRCNLAFVSASSNDAEFEKHRLATGICKPSLMSGLHSSCCLPVPTGFSLDSMHLPALNVPDVLLNFYRGTFKCDPNDDKSTWTWAVFVGDVWIEHGAAVARAKNYLPASYERPPRNPAEKINSGYKTQEFLTYMIGLGPGLFRGILPDIYYRHYCKYVAGIRLLLQRRISKLQLIKSHMLMCDFVYEFEILFYQRKECRLHFCRPSIHTLLHLAPETYRTSPGVYDAQWTLERTIGNLGEEVKQPSHPFANLAQRALRRCQINALRAMLPDLEPDLEYTVPYGSIDLGDGFVLLRARDRYRRLFRGPEAAAIRAYLSADPAAEVKVKRWARLRLPNGQIARSAWKETLRPLEQTQMSRNIKVSLHINLVFADIDAKTTVSACLLDWFDYR